MRIFSLADRPLKVNLHMHTNLSDGKQSPLLALQAYEDAGYDAVAITDHRTVTTVPDYRDDMLVLPGMEWDVNLNRGGEVIHLLGIGMAEGFSYERQRENDAQRFADAVRKAGGLCFFCHPHWSMNRVETLLSMKGLSGAEIFNGVSRPPYNLDRADATFYLDMAASEGCLIPTIATDDSHHYGLEAFTGFIYLNAQKNRDSVMAALKAGNFLASQGPKIHSVSLEESQVRVETSPVSHITFHSNLAWTPQRCVSGDQLTRASIQINPKMRFIRVVVIDDKGRRAWSNPFRV